MAGPPQKPEIDDRMRPGDSPVPRLTPEDWGRPSIELKPVQKFDSAVSMDFVDGTTIVRHDPTRRNDGLISEEGQQIGDELRTTVRTYDPQYRNDGLVSERATDEGTTYTHTYSGRDDSMTSEERVVDKDGKWVRTTFDYDESNRKDGLLSRVVEGENETRTYNWQVNGLKEEVQYGQPPKEIHRTYDPNFSKTPGLTKEVEYQDGKIVRSFDPSYSGGLKSETVDDGKIVREYTDGRTTEENTKLYTPKDHFVPPDRAVIKTEKGGDALTTTYGPNTEARMKEVKYPDRTVTSYENRHDGLLEQTKYKDGNIVRKFEGGKLETEDSAGNIVRSFNPPREDGLIGEKEPIRGQGERTYDSTKSRNGVKRQTVVKGDVKEAEFDSSRHPHGITKALYGQDKDTLYYDTNHPNRKDGLSVEHRHKDGRNVREYTGRQDGKVTETEYPDKSTVETYSDGKKLFRSPDQSPVRQELKDDSPVPLEQRRRREEFQIPKRRERLQSEQLQQQLSQFIKALESQRFPGIQEGQQEDRTGLPPKRTEREPNVQKLDRSQPREQLEGQRPAENFQPIMEQFTQIMQLLQQLMQMLSQISQVMNANGLSDVQQQPQPKRRQV